MKSVSVFGSTGSIGQSTLKVIAHHRDDYDVRVLSAYSNVDQLAAQAREFGAAKAVIADDSLYNDLKEALSGSGIEAAAGEDALCEAASEPVDWTMAAIVGMAGLKPLMAAIERGGVIAIANKEPLVAAGALVMESAKRHGATLLPVDSEHNAVFQVFDSHNKNAIERIILTASGGPFRTASRDELMCATPKQALNHPNWSMGDKITIDSATYMNKALELIEAKILFDVDLERIEVLVHPQSVVHSMVEYADGSILAQMGAPDMCTPITHALGWPERIEGPGAKLDLSALSELTFEAVDHERFPAINLAYDALKRGQAACLALNAANEQAVAAFLDKRIGFCDIVDIAGEISGKAEDLPLNSLDAILGYDTDMRGLADHAIAAVSSKRTEAA